jgi:hypothetical protein
MVGGFLWVLRLSPQLKLAADIIRCIKNDNDLLNLPRLLPEFGNLLLPLV